ncbi:hypothetical protein LNM21_004412 [Salmonella enterica subsp. enterica serovar Mokola]|nr:hypothetical protein [Salmonella enterica]EEP9743639.1 hypothetical protein [Salmonella enterica subsp. enterica serovar Elisabethville]EHO4927963.1 hypothetical protein [Salmonella enterica subsp. enterica serovar Corvallis]EIM5305560.1 hypothetical protein [Salmonella enterica subsp. enterica serovar Mokola]EHO4298790.1 hypothetical protein [Salmonella enterica]EHQ0126202.1 hypothetical protein [Salmonella enterica subsp. enterica serovar Elisabethville]
MFTINSTNRMASPVEPYAHVSNVSLDNNVTLITSKSLNKDTLRNVYNSPLQCFVLNDHHVPHNTSARDVTGYNLGLKERIKCEYQPNGGSIYLLGTPAVLEAKESLSLPVSSFALTQKLLKISNSNNCEFSGSTSYTAPASHNASSGYIAQYRNSAEVYPAE